ncbi:MAG: outer membrane beta-barrel protein [Hyphomicrobiaceae bacterium]
MGGALVLGTNPRKGPETHQTFEMHIPHASSAGGELRISLATLSTIAIVALTTTCLVEPANALDLDGTDGLNTETVASRERIKDWDNIKQYGAERVLEDRDRQHVAAEGVRAGSYLIFPSADANVIFDDNIFNRDADKHSDIKFELAPEVQFNSRLPRHALNFSLNGKLVSYLENTEQNYENIGATVGGALHFDHAHTLSASILSELTHDERGSITAPKSALGPIPVFHNRISAGITRDVGRLYGTVYATAETFDYKDVRAVDGSILDQDTRDTEIYSAQLRAGYRFSPGYDFISKVRLLRQYNTGFGNQSMDSHGYEAVGGLAFETNPLLRWRVVGGVGLRDFDDPALDNILTTLAEAQMQWLPTQRMTITGKLKREIIDTVSAEDGGRVETSLSGRVDYDIYNNLVLSVGGSYSQAEFFGTTREDDALTGKISLNYFLNKNWLFTFAYEHEFRDSTQDIFDSSRNRYLIGAKMKF